MARAARVLLVLVLLAAFLAAPVFFLLPDSDAASCLEELTDGVRPVCEPPPEVDLLCPPCLAGRSLGGASSSGFLVLVLVLEEGGAWALEVDRLGLCPPLAWPTSWALAALAGGGAPPGAFVLVAALPEAWPASCASAALASGVLGMATTVEAPLGAGEGDLSRLCPKHPVDMTMSGVSLGTMVKTPFSACSPL